jgi:DNA-binding CsgD family transcriptional regulator
MRAAAMESPKFNFARKLESTDRYLTPREQQVLIELAQTGRYKTAAHALGISEQTVKNHMSKVFRRWDASSLVHLFFRLGWLVTPDKDRVEPLEPTRAARVSEWERQATDLIHRISQESQGYMHDGSGRAVSAQTRSEPLLPDLPPVDEEELVEAPDPAIWENARPPQATAQSRHDQMHLTPVFGCPLCPEPDPGPELPSEIRAVLEIANQSEALNEPSSRGRF